MNTSTTLVHTDAGNFTAGPLLPTFDLSHIMGRVQKEHPDWSAERIQQAELMYRRYLALCKLYPQEQLAPSPDADEMWHAHILHTAHYERDCMEYFGYFLHHVPCEWSADERTNNKVPALYLATFGETYPEGSDATCTKTATCAGSGCMNNCGNDANAQAGAVLPPDGRGATCINDIAARASSDHMGKCCSNAGARTAAA